MVKRSRNRYGLGNPFDAKRFHRLLSNALGFPSVSSDLELISAAMPSTDLDRGRFRDEFLLREVVRKYPGFDLGIDTQTAAIESFWDDERLNYRTNQRLMGGCGLNVRVSQVLDLAGRKAGRILGRFSWDDFEDGLRFGPGATTSRKHKEAAIHCKLTGANHCTSKAIPLWEVCLKTRPMWGADFRTCGIDEAVSTCTPPPIVPYETDVLLVVPKNARTGRTIGKGPDANVVMQLALGYCMRKRMYHREGVNLNDQSINQQRALAGSLSGHLATVDLKSASNSVTTGLVYRMLGNLPHDVADPRWYWLLDTLRVESVLVEKTRVHNYELFSCMGNGSTFELESLLFYSLAWASCVVLGVEPDCTVYGDDLVVPVEVMDLLVEVLAFCGLRVNSDKTFSDPKGGFRESCGKCYFNGFDVTAFYLDKPVVDAYDIFVLANNITRWARGPFGRDGRLKVVWEWVTSHLPYRLRTFVGPLTGSDSHLAMDFDEAHRFVQVQRNPGCAGISGFAVKGLERVSLPEPVDDELAYLTALYQASYRRFKPSEPEKHVRTVLLPGRRKAGSGYEGRNLSVKLSVPHVVTQSAWDKPGRLVIHEMRTLVPPIWPLIGPWEYESTDDEIRGLILTQSYLRDRREPDLVPLTSPPRNQNSG